MLTLQHQAHALKLPYKGLQQLLLVAYILAQAVEYKLEPVEYKPVLVRNHLEQTVGRNSQLLVRQ